MRLAPRNSSERYFMKTDEATGRALNTTLEDFVAERTAAA
jgi:hypothetical protein